MAISPDIHGTCDSEFLPVKHAFSDNFARRKEAGASVCVVIDGKKVVDLWGGTVDKKRTKPWLENTLATGAVTMWLTSDGWWAKWSGESRG